MQPWIKRSLKRTLFGLFGATLLIGSLGACSSYRDGHRGQMSEEDATKFRTKMVERVGKELELNDQQKQRLGVLTDKLREQRTALIGKTTNPRAEMQTLVAGTQFDRAKASAFVEEKTSLLQQKSPEVIAALADFYDSLNPAQQQKVRDFLDRRGRWFHRG